MNAPREKYDDAGELLAIGDEVVAHFGGGSVLIGRVTSTEPTGMVTIKVLQLLDNVDAKLFRLGEEFNIMGPHTSKARVAAERER